MWHGPQFGFGHVFRKSPSQKRTSFWYLQFLFLPLLYKLSRIIVGIITSSSSLPDSLSQQLSSGVTLPLSDLFSCLLSKVLENHFFMPLSHLYSTSDKTVIPVVHAASLSPISPCWEFSVPRSLPLAQPSSQGITWWATQTGSIQWELKQGPYGLVA